MFLPLKELRHRSCILKKIVKVFIIVISNQFQSSPSQLSLFLFALESSLRVVVVVVVVVVVFFFFFIANHYF